MEVGWGGNPGPELDSIDGDFVRVNLDPEEPMIPPGPALAEPDDAEADCSVAVLDWSHGG